MSNMAKHESQGGLEQLLLILAMAAQLYTFVLMAATKHSGGHPQAHLWIFLSWLLWGWLAYRIVMSLIEPEVDDLG